MHISHDDHKKCNCYGHISCSLVLVKTILEGILKGGTKTWWTKDEVERRHEGMDRQVTKGIENGEI